MVYLTGDTHGDIDRFKHGKLRWLGKRDTVVVLGDFGFVWDGSAAERKRLDWLRKRPYTILFLDGSHENYDLLAQYPETELFGGRVQSLGGNVYHVCRGSVLELEGKKYLCFGGAESPDREEREPGELAKVSQTLADVQGNVIKLEHNQFVTTNRSAAVELRITLECFGTEHKEQIIAALEKKGYKPRIVRTMI